MSDTLVNICKSIIGISLTILGTTAILSITYMMYKLAIS